FGPAARASNLPPPCNVSINGKELDHQFWSYETRDRISFVFRAEKAGEYRIECSNRLDFDRKMVSVHGSRATGAQWDIEPQPGRGWGFAVEWSGDWSRDRSALPLPGANSGSDFRPESRKINVVGTAAGRPSGLHLGPELWAAKPLWLGMRAEPSCC